MDFKVLASFKPNCSQDLPKCRKFLCASQANVCDINKPWAGVVY
jgi:hypothetical protein